MKIHRLYGGAFITEDNNGNLKYYNEDYIKSNLDITTINVEELRKEWIDIMFLLQSKLNMERKTDR